MSLREAVRLIRATTDAALRRRIELLAVTSLQATGMTAQDARAALQAAVSDHAG